MTTGFECETRIAAPPTAAFDASLDIDLHVRSMRASGERAIAGVTSGRIGADETVTWRARHFGFPFTMTSAITELERPYRFVDEQRSGPFASFRHEHRFEADAAGTLMLDRIRFRAPFGFVGRLVEPALRVYLRRLIEERNRHVRESAEASAAL